MRSPLTSSSREARTLRRDLVREPAEPAAGDEHALGRSRGRVREELVERAEDGREERLALALALGRPVADEAEQNGEGVRTAAVSMPVCASGDERAGGRSDIEGRTA